MTTTTPPSASDGGGGCGRCDGSRKTCRRRRRSACRRFQLRSAAVGLASRSRSSSAAEQFFAIIFTIPNSQSTVQCSVSPQLRKGRFIKPIRHICWIDSSDSTLKNVYCHFVILNFHLHSQLGMRLVSLSTCLLLGCRALRVALDTVSVHVRRRDGRDGAFSFGVIVGV